MSIESDSITLIPTNIGVGSMVDGAMSRMVESGKVAVGTKLVIHGAELTGGSPHPCHPLEVGDELAFCKYSMYVCSLCVYCITVLPHFTSFLNQVT